MATICVLSAGSSTLKSAVDDVANAAGGPLLTTAASKLPAYTIPTDEALTIARHTASLI